MKTVDREVSWKVYDVSVYGTLTAPITSEPRAAVVFVAGSGPTDRDWCSPFLPGTNGSGKLLAERLASQGFVTLRYDKVASGPHVRENIPKLIGRISMKSHVEELRGAVETVVAEEIVDRNSVFALTNSEGAIHAVNYQLGGEKNRFKGLVLTGAPGRAVGEVSRGQILNQVKYLPNGETMMRQYDEAVEDFMADRPLRDEPLPDGNISLLIRSLRTPANLPFARELWSYSLPEYLTRVEECMLVLIGKRDIQVDWKLDGDRLREAVGRRGLVSFAFPQYANHVLKHEEMPVEKITVQYAGSHYNAPDAELDEEAVDSILNWLKASA